MSIVTTIKRNANVMAKKYGNHISIGAGIALVIGAGVWAVVDAVKKTAPIVEEAKEDFTHANEVDDIIENQPALAEERGYSPATSSKMRKDAIVRCGLKITKVHAKHIVMGGAGIGFILHGVHGLSAECAELSTALAGAIASNQKIMERVEQECDPETAARIKYGVSKEEAEQMKDFTQTDEWNDMSEEERNKVIYGNRECSCYSFFYDAGCSMWTKSPSRNRESIELIRAELEDLMMIRGFINLNDIYRAFGVDEKCKPGLSKLGYRYEAGKRVQLDYADARFINEVEATVEVDIKNLEVLFH